MVVREVVRYGLGVLSGSRGLEEAENVLKQVRQVHFTEKKKTGPNKRTSRRGFDDQHLPCFLSLSFIRLSLFWKQENEELRIRRCRDDTPDSWQVGCVLPVTSVVGADSPCENRGGNASVCLFPTPNTDNTWERPAQPE